MDLNTKIAVVKRAKGSVGYKIDTLRVSRSWKHDAKDPIYIPVAELIELTTIPGGRKLLEEYLIIQDEEARLEVLGIETSPEYLYTEKEVNYLLHKASNEQLLDCLDYAPIGVLDLIKMLAIQAKPDTTVKIDAINAKFNINLEELIKLNAELRPASEEGHIEAQTERRSAPIVLDEQEPIKRYKIIK